MNVLTLKIPDELDAALQAASRTRGLSKSAVVREALEASLLRQADQAGASKRWVAQWRGRLSAPPLVTAGRKAKPAAKSAVHRTPAAQDERLAHLLAKHLR